jgi:hypothetical protein
LNLRRAAAGKVETPPGMESPGPRARCPVQQQRARWERKRACTARELLETERRYQEQLGLVATVGACARGDPRVWVTLPAGRELRQTSTVSGCTLALASSSSPSLKYLYSLLQYFLGILKAKGTLRPPERQTLFGPWELIYDASQ